MVRVTAEHPQSHWRTGTFSLKALVDSGSVCNVLNLSSPFFERRPPSLPLRPSSRSLKSASGQVIPVLGEIDLSITLRSVGSGTTTTQTFFVARLPAAYDMILGGPWFAKHLIAFDLAHGVVFVDHDQVLLQAACMHQRDESSEPELALITLPHWFRETNDTSENSDVFVIVWPEGNSVEVPEELRDDFAVPEDEVDTLDNGLTPEEESRATAFRQHVFEKYKEYLVDELPESVAKANGLPFVLRLNVNGAPPPPKAGIIRLSDEHLEELRRQMTGLLKLGIIRPCSSAYAAPVFFAKKNGSSKLRMVISYRALNQQLVDDAHDLPDVEETLSKLGAAPFRSLVDLCAAFHQLPVHPDDIEKTAFTCRFGQYCWTTAPFGLKTLPGVFSRLIEHVLAPSLEERHVFAVPYLDDVLIFSPTLDDHFRHVDTILRRLTESRLYVSRKKCVLVTKRLRYAGRLLDEHSIKPDPDKTAAMASYPPPSTRRDLQRFLGAANFLQQHVAGFAEKAAPLFEALKSSPFVLPMEAFTDLRQAVVDSVALAFPVKGQPFTIFCDTSRVATGAMLTQGDRPIAFFSRKLKDAETRYPVREIELLGIVTALRRWRHYIFGHRVLIVTDHRSLEHLRFDERTRPRLANHMVQLDQVGADLRWIPGSEMQLPDALSRCWTPRRLPPEPTVEDQDEAAEVHAIALGAETDLGDILNAEATAEGDGSISTLALDEQTIEEFIAAYLQDDNLCDVYRRLRGLGPNRPLQGKGQSRLNSQLATYSVDDKGLMFFTNEHGRRLAVPADATLRSSILQSFHLDFHPGAVRMYLRMRSVVHWRAMKKDIHDFVASCPDCQANKSTRQARHGLLTPLEIPAAPWTSLSLDFVGPLITSAAGNNIIIVVVDRFSGMVFLRASASRPDDGLSTTAEDVARLIFEEWYAVSGRLPTSIVSDRDSRFTSQFWKSLWGFVGTKLRMSSAWHPQTDGKTERYNRVVLDALRCLIDSTHTDWDTRLKQIALGMNTTPSTVHGFAPCQLATGVPPLLPHDLFAHGGNTPTVTEVKEYLLSWDEHVERAREAMVFAAIRAKENADLVRRHVEFKPGDRVWVDSSILRLPGDTRPKLQALRTGPFRVLERLSDVSYRIDFEGAHPLVHPVIHVSRLTHYRPADETRFPGAFQRWTFPEPDEDGEHEVERIVRVEVAGGRRYYRVKWKNFPESHNSRCRIEDFPYSRHLVEEFERAEAERLAAEKEAAEQQDRDTRRVTTTASGRTVLLPKRIAEATVGVPAPATATLPDEDVSTTPATARRRARNRDEEDEDYTPQAQKRARVSKRTAPPLTPPTPSATAEVTPPPPPEPELGRGRRQRRQRQRQE